jgi:antitoxin PrlF
MNRRRTGTPARIRELAAPAVISTALERENLAIGTFLLQLEADLRGSGRVRALPDELARAMLANLGHAEDFDEEIEGEVAL